MQSHLGHSLQLFLYDEFKCLLSDLNKALGNPMDAHEAAQMHQTFSQQLLQDHIAACSLPEHNLISVREPLCLMTFFLANV